MNVTVQSDHARRSLWVPPIVILAGILLAYGVFRLLARFGY